MVATLQQQQQQQQEKEEEEEEEEEEEGGDMAGGGGGGGGVSINDNVDLLAEILGRLDARSLAAAAHVCRLWAAVSRHDALWESLCLRCVSSSSSSSPSPSATRSVVAALGGYRRLYRLCLSPALDRLNRRQTGPNRWAVEPRPILLDRAEAQAQAHLSVSLSLVLSLFSIDCYERLGPARQRPVSLLFLCKPVDLA